METISDLNKQFNNGVLPDCFNFQLPQNGNIDISKLQYNTFYRSFEFAESKFPQGHEGIPNFDKVIEMCQCDHTPLEEMNEIHDKSKKTKKLWKDDSEVSYNK